MNKRIAAELRKELQFIEAGIDVKKHAYAMKTLLGLISESDETGGETPAELEENVTIRRTPVAKSSADEDDDGNGKDIFDF